MFAVIKTGGKQYKVAKNDIVTVERLAGEEGASVDIDKVLMVAGGDGAAQVGAPVVDGAVVSAEIVEQARGPKIEVFKKKRRKHYRRHHGHRQDQTVLRITDIRVGGESVAGDVGEPKPYQPRRELREATNAAVVAQRTVPKSKEFRKRDTGRSALRSAAPVEDDDE